MTAALVVLGFVAGALFLWGTIAPRSFWYSFVAPARTDPRNTEPSRPAFAAGRFLSLIGFVVLATTGVTWAAGLPPFGDRGQRSVVESVWGRPVPVVIDRVLAPVASPPEGLVRGTVTGYQAVDGEGANPAYLFTSPAVRDAGVAAQPGFIGTAPAEGVVALSSADLVVRVVSDARCIPQQVVLVSTDSFARVSVLIGAPTSAEPAPAPDGTTPTDPAVPAAEPIVCEVNPPRARQAVWLLPIDLGAPLGTRSVETLEGLPVDAVPAPQG